MKKINVSPVARALFGVGLAALGASLSAHAQMPFAKPEAAADALINAIATNDAGALPGLLGKDWHKLVRIDTVDTNDVYLFLEKASQVRKVEVKGTRGDLSVGTDPWTLPVPITQGKDGQWRFDTVLAQDVLAERRIGANERAAMQAVLAYVDAQREYALVDRDADGVLQYAQKLISSPGKRDGLIWSPSLGDESPLGEAYVPKTPGQGYHGYHYKILTGQGDKAPGGARSYLIGRRMTAGFALLAWPVKYGTTGVMSFMVGSDGKVFERDLGPQSAQAAANIKLYNPDATWMPAKP